tara:strand:- start:269 stop:808 length:540 start_codon:yes stop_codon:yes gene_type:complete
MVTGSTAMVIAAVVSTAATVISAKQQSKAAAAAAALAQQQAEERKAIIQADMLDKENEILRNQGRTLATIRNRRPHDAGGILNAGTQSVKAGIKEEIKLGDRDIRNVKIQGLSAIRQDQFSVAKADLQAAGARSRFGMSVLKGIGTIGLAAGKAGAFDGLGFSGGTTRGDIAGTPSGTG